MRPPAAPDSGLPRPDVFYFGHLTAESGADDVALRVNALDVAAVKKALSAAAVGVGSAADFNRDGRVNALDVALARARLGSSLGTLVAPALVGLAPTGAAALRAYRLWNDQPPDPLA